MRNDRYHKNYCAERKRNKPERRKSNFHVVGERLNSPAMRGFIAQRPATKGSEVERRVSHGDTPEHTQKAKN